jgi:hypothetical protein
MRKLYFFAGAIADALKKRSREPQVSMDEISSDGEEPVALRNLPNRLTEDDIVWGNSKKRLARDRFTSSALRALE